MILRALFAFWTSSASQMANHLWQSTLFLAVAAILALALRKNQARVRYWVWLTASVKFLIPFSLLIALGSHLARPRVSTPAQVIVYSAVEDFSQPFAGQQMPVIYHSAPAAPAAPVSLLHLLPAMVVAVWLVGIVVVLLRWVIGWVRISLMVRKAASVGEGREVDALRRLESSLGLRTPIRLVLSPDWMEPGIFGLFRPVLIWPEGISQHLDNRHIEAILAHEVCHARRRDSFTAVLHMMVEAIFWIHPLVWWMGARLEEERERACDEEVSLLCNQPHVYAESILKVCKFCSESPLTCVSGITGADLKKRIVEIMTERVVRKLGPGRKLLLVAVGLAVVAVPILLGQVKGARRLESMILAPSLKLLPSLMVAQGAEATGAGDDAAQDVDAGKPIAFAVATIRTLNPGGQRSGQTRRGFTFRPDGFEAYGTRLDVLIEYAYQLQFNQYRILGAPDWAVSQLFDIQAKVDETDVPEMSKLVNDSSKEGDERRRRMLQEFLAERFKLKVHRETREGTIYALVVAKGGPKLKPSTSDDPPKMVFGQGHLAVERTVIGAMAPFFAQELGSEVVDKTGLNGKYDFTLDWASDRGLAAPGADTGTPTESSGPSIFTAVQEQLGLKLEAQKGSIKTLVIDSAEKPSVDGAEVTQKPSSTVAFEVETVKPGHFDPTTYGPHISRDRASYRGVTLRDIVAFAYGVNLTQVSGPDQINDERYDIEATFPDGTTKDDVTRMLQELLKRRFAMALHLEKRDATVYALVVDKHGAKLKPSVSNSVESDMDAPLKPGERYVGEGYDRHRETTNKDGSTTTDLGKDGTLTQKYDPQTSMEHWERSNITMGEFAGWLMPIIEMAGGGLWTVVDQTGIEGNYQIAVDYKLGFQQTKAGADPGPIPFESLSGGLLDKSLKALGLRLETRKEPIDTYVVDHVEKPSPN